MIILSNIDGFFEVRNTPRDILKAAEFMGLIMTEEDWLLQELKGVQKLKDGDNDL